MKGKDNRIVTIAIPSTQTSEIIEFNVALSDLENVYREAVKNNYEAITLTYGDLSEQLPIKQLKHIIISAIKQYESLKLIPKALNKYLISNPSAITERIVGRDQEIDRIWTYLTSTQKSNTILIGDHGVGKTTIASEIMRQINLGECPKQFRKYHVVTINTNVLLELADTSTFRYSMIIQRLTEFIKENKENVIFYIDNLLHVKCDLELLKLFRKCLFDYNIKFIASINDEDFEDYFEIDTELMKCLNNLWIEEPEIEEVYPMIKNRINILQTIYGVTISERMIHFAISTADFHAHFNRANPEKTIDAINFALADAQRKGQKEVTKQNFFSYYKIDFREVSKIPKEREKIVAYHEVGHCLVGMLLPNLKCHKIDNVSILPTDYYGGVTVHHLAPMEYSLFSKDYYIDYIAYLLGGRVGEMFYTNVFSSGAESDLAKANAFAEDAVLSSGLTEVDGGKNKTYISMGYVKDYLLTDDVKTKINTEIEKIMREAYERAQNIINDNKELFEEIVQRLREDKILVADELDEICKKYIKDIDNS